MSSVLSAELAATCNALGYFDSAADKYFADSNTLETVKDLIRYLRRDDDTHEIRRHLGATKVLQTDLIPLLKSYWEQDDLFDVLLRLLVNLTTPPLMLWREEIPLEKITRNYYLQIEDHLKSYKDTLADEGFWALLAKKLGKILEIDYAERGDENSLIIERILILVRNILYVPPDPATEKRPDNDASIHDQVLWALHQSGFLDIILYMSGTINEKAYYMHILEILSFLLREQKASELASVALQRSETEKIRDDAELAAIRHRESARKQDKIKMHTGARHSRFGGTYVVKTMKSISDNDLIYHKPLNKLDSLNFDSNKQKVKTPKNRAPLQSTTFERRSALTIRLFLKEFAVEFLNSSYNTLMYHVKDNLVRAKAQAHDESYYLWALRFFMEFNRCYKAEVKFVSETLSVSTFRYVQQFMENYFDMIQTDKKKLVLWSRRLHLALLAYKELLFTICSMDKSVDGTVRDSSRVIKNNIFYILEYREFIITLLLTYDELKMSGAYLSDLMETQHIFVKMLESFCGESAVLVEQKARKKKNRKNKKRVPQQVATELNLESMWDETSAQLTAILEDNTIVYEDVVPFDAASDIPIDEQKGEAMKNVQRKLRAGDLETGIGLLRAARRVWPENDCFGSSTMSPEEEFLALRDIFHADLGENQIQTEQIIEEQPIYDHNNEEEDEENENDITETDFKFEHFVKRLCNPKVVKACGLALKQFESNKPNTNHCIIKLLHRIAFDCKMYVMVFQVSIFRTFQQIYANKEFPQYKELVKFATFIIRQFVSVAQINDKLFMEALFWKNSADAHDIEHGYGTYHNKLPATAWTEDSEYELRQLFMEHRENQSEEDVVDWIVNNMVDKTKSRRLVLKKLREMNLLVDYKGRSKSKGNSKSKRVAWNEDEETQLRRLFEEFREADDSVGCIIARLDAPRSKQKIVDKLLELNLIADKSEVMKRKRTKKSQEQQQQRTRQSDSSDSEEDGSQMSTRKTISKSSLPSRKKPNRNSNVPVSYNHIARLVMNLQNSGFSEALEWLKESFSDAVEDFEEDGMENECVPLVPIMDYAINAMESEDFRKALKAMGIAEPFDEQEVYWRIPGSLTIDLLKQYIELLNQALNNTLTVPDEQTAGSNAEPNRFHAGLIDNDESSRESVQVLENSNQEAQDTRTFPISIVDSNSSDEDRPKENSPVKNKRSILMEMSDDENVFPETNLESRTVQNTSTLPISIVDSDSSDEDLPKITAVKNKRKILMEMSDEENVVPETNLESRNETSDMEEASTSKRSRYLLSDDSDQENQLPEVGKPSKRSRYIESDDDDE